MKENENFPLWEGNNGKKNDTLYSTNMKANENFALWEDNNRKKNYNLYSANNSFEKVEKEVFISAFFINTYIRQVFHYSPCSLFLPRKENISFWVTVTIKCQV